MKSHDGKDAQAPLRCAITDEELPKSKLVTLEHLRPALVERIRKDFPNVADSDHISRREADRFRTLYVEEMLHDEPFDEIMLSVAPHTIERWLHVDLAHRVAHLGLPVTLVR